MTFIVSYTYQSYWNVFLRGLSLGGRYLPIHLHRIHSILIYKTVVIINLLVSHLDVLLHLCPKPAPLILQNLIHFEIFGFVRLDFSCFTNKEICSVFHKPQIRFLRMQCFINKNTTDTKI